MTSERDSGSAALVRVVRPPSCPDVAHLVIDNPPVNALSHAVRRQLLDAIEFVARDETVKAAVLIGAGRNFVAGSDIREFDGPIAEPSLPVVIAALENCPKTIVAAIRGVALGGGFELALGCDVRIGDADAKIGLPEATLGMIPGAGGTVKLPRLIGTTASIDLICAGIRVPADQALRLGIFDALADADDLENAAGRLALSTGKHRIRDLSAPPIDGSFEARAKELVKKARGRAAIPAAIDAVRRAVELPFDVALSQERAVFQDMRVNDEAAALRHVFFAERRAGRVEGVAVPHPTIRTAAVIGSGTMGAGIAACFIAVGLPTILIDSNEEALRAGVVRIEAIHASSIASGKINESEAQTRMARLTSASSLDATSDVDIVVEAVFEDMELKKHIFRALDRITRGDSILASNTSYLDLDAIAAATSRPQRVFGLHFFSPAHVMRLTEVVRGRETAPAVLDAGVRLARRLGKLPVIAGVGEGFIGNRILAAYRQQCEVMLDEGALPKEIDRAMTNFGFPMGLFAVWDLAGLDIAWRARKQLASSGNHGQTPSVLDELCERGRFGRKTGAGWYLYDKTGAAGASDPVVGELIAAHAKLAGKPPRHLPEAEIIDRILAAMVNAGALVVEEGVAACAGDVDLVMINGYGFPAHKGGPMFWASRQPRDKLLAALDALAGASGQSFRRADVTGAFDTLPPR